jgi:hypothetical protein
MSETERLNKQQKNRRMGESWEEQEMFKFRQWIQAFAMLEVLQTSPARPSDRMKMEMKVLE